MKCIKCGSLAFNLQFEGINQGDLCDVHYWQERAHRAEALAEQPAQQEPVAWVDEATHYQPQQKAFYKRVSATEWYVWSRIEQEPLHWCRSLGTSDGAHWILRHPARHDNSDDLTIAYTAGLARGKELALAEQPAQQERKFCPRCGKRVGSNDWDVHTCTPQQPEQEPNGLAAYVIGCFSAAEAEGLTDALAETTDERLKDLVERRLMYAMYEAQKAQPKEPEPEPVKIAHKHEWFRTGGMKVGQMRCISCGTWGQEEMPQRTWARLMRGVRVDGDTVVITVKGSNDAARELCVELLKEKNECQ